MGKRACGCETDRLRRHVEGRLEEGEQELLATHLDRCEHCRGSLGRARPATITSGVICASFLVDEPDSFASPAGAGRPGSGRAAGTVRAR